MGDKDGGQPKLPESGDLVGGRYEILGELGRGAMGVVYRARDKNLDRPVAIKFLSPDLAGKEEAVARFGREALAAGRIGHEGICDVRDRGVADGGVPYIVMELLEGKSLADVLERDRRGVEPDRAVKIILQALLALEAAHRVGIVHRDIKPENIFLAKLVGGGERVKIIDFGISKILNGDATDSPRLTKTGFVLGSPCYMSPEQVKGKKDVDHRIDIWGVGVVLYEMLVGRAPFDGDNYNEVMIDIATTDPEDPCDLNPEISREMADVILKALAREPKDRFANAAAFAEALREAVAGNEEHEEVEGGDGDADEEGAPPPASTPEVVMEEQGGGEVAITTRWRWGLLVVITFVVFGLGVGMGILWWWFSPPPAPTIPDAPPAELDAAPTKATDAGVSSSPEPPLTVEVIHDATHPSLDAEASVKAVPGAGAGGKRPRKRGPSLPPRVDDGGIKQVLVPALEEPRILPPPIKREILPSPEPRILPPPRRREDGGPAPPQKKLDPRL